MKYIYCTLIATVRYTAEVHADVPWGVDKKRTIEFFVNGINDLNEEYETMDAVSFSLRS